MELNVANQRLKAGWRVHYPQSHPTWDSAENSHGRTRRVKYIKYMHVLATALSAIKASAQNAAGYKWDTVPTGGGGYATFDPGSGNIV